MRAAGARTGAGICMAVSYKRSRTGVHARAHMRSWLVVHDCRLLSSNAFMFLQAVAKPADNCPSVALAVALGKPQLYVAVMFGQDEAVARLLATKQQELPRPTPKKLPGDSAADSFTDEVRKRDTAFPCAC